MSKTLTSSDTYRIFKGITTQSKANTSSFEAMKNDVFVKK